MNVLVTGGTGFVGRAILRELHAAGHRVHVLARHANSRNATASETQFRSGNILDRTSIQNACASIDAIIHLVGIISEVGPQTFENVHTRGTENVIAAARSCGVKRFIHMSALGTRPNAVARYHQSKWAAEEAVRASGLHWTLFRPSIVYGPGDGFVNLFAKIIRRCPVVPILGSGQTRFQPVPVENVSAAFVRALTEPRSIGQTYDLCGAETFTMNEIVDQILSVMNRKRLKLHIPLAVARLQAAVMEFVFGKVLRKAPPLNRDQVAMLQEDNAGNGRPADELFELSATKFHQGIARYLQK